MKAERSHGDLTELIPWYANGTLSAEERAMVEEHLKTCGACRQELQFLRNVNAAMTGLDEDVPAVEPSFAKVWTAIETSETREPAARWSLASWFRQIWNPSAPAVRLVFAAQLLIILLLGVYVWRARQVAPAFNTLSGPEVTTGGARLTVSFAANTSVAQMNQILTAVGGQIVSGPSASGIYIVRLSLAETQDAQVQATIDELRTNGAIRFVERQP
jgi:hypothetical protein